jgi:succinate dehydrogenase/fumarate reductase iron-sulfur protein
MPFTLVVSRDAETESTFVIEADEGSTVLDLLERIRRGTDPTLLFRHSCHHGSCGTCSCLIDGREGLACLTRAADLGSGPIALWPLRKTEVIGDLAVDPAAEFLKIPSEASSLRPSEWNAGVPTPWSVGELREAVGESGLSGSGGFSRFENCIECFECVSACPVESPFLGPAALAAIDRELEKGSTASGTYLARADEDDGVRACERKLACSRVCPRAVYPARRIKAIGDRLAGS